ncbi:uncharacterized protein isoform X2 [Musca autumnalis]
MDPCQKNWNILEKYIKKIPKNSVEDNYVLGEDFEEHMSKEELIYSQIRKFGISKTSSEEEDEPPRKREKISNNRQKMIDFVKRTSNYLSNDNVSHEITKYFEIPVEITESLDWWKEHIKLFPRVGELANIYFGIPATSASSEIAFSYAGSCITEKRSRLNPSTVRKQLFVHDNYKSVN